MAAAGQRVWKRRSVEKTKTGLFHRAWKSRLERGISTFPHPRRRVSGNILYGATTFPKVTFLNGLTRAQPSFQCWVLRRTTKGVSLTTTGPRFVSAIRPTQGSMTAVEGL